MNFAFRLVLKVQFTNFLHFGGMPHGKLRQK